jgi:uncharacterized protein YkwD
VGNVLPRSAPLLLVVCALVFAGLSGFVQTPDAAAATPTRAEKTLIRVINDARAARGLVRLRIGDRIQSAAHRWAWYLLNKDAFFHGSLAYGVTENIAWLTCRTGWARTIVQMWLNSPAHRVNMLDRSARRIGVGVASGRWKGYSCVRMAVARFR